jgi:hypothetical protein
MPSTRRVRSRSARSAARPPRAARPARPLRASTDRRPHVLASAVQDNCDALRASYWALKKEDRRAMALADLDEAVRQVRTLEELTGLITCDRASSYGVSNLLETAHSVRMRELLRPMRRGLGARESFR